MKVTVYFRQINPFRDVSKEIELAAVPYPGTFFEYQDGWGLAEVGGSGRLSLHITAEGVSVSDYGPQFSEEELADLKENGWTVG